LYRSVRDLSKADSSGQSGVLVLLGVLFTLILAGLDNTIVSTVMPVALPELGSAHLYAWTFAAYMLAAAVSMPIWGPGSDRWGRRRTYLIGIVGFTVGSGLCAIARTMMEFMARAPSRASEREPLRRFRLFCSELYIRLTNAAGRWARPAVRGQSRVSPDHSLGH
jgi:MFS family permease